MKAGRRTSRRWRRALSSNMQASCLGLVYGREGGSGPILISLGKTIAASRLACYRPLSNARTSQNKAKTGAPAPDLAPAVTPQEPSGPSKVEPPSSHLPVHQRPMLLYDGHPAPLGCEFGRVRHTSARQSIRPEQPASFGSSEKNHAERQSERRLRHCFMGRAECGAPASTLLPPVQFIAADLPSFLAAFAINGR